MSFKETNRHQPSSMSTTLTATASSAFAYSDEELENELEFEFEDEAPGLNLTDLDVRKETEAFLQDNKLRLDNIRFSFTLFYFFVSNFIFSSKCRSFIQGF